MKKIAIAISAFMLVGILFSSCKTHERCPAYGKVVTETDQEKV